MSEEKITEYTLPFVKNGEKFKLSRWTVLKQQEVLNEVKKFEKELSEKDLDEKYRTLIILRALHEIDKNVKESDINAMHPDDKIALFAACYLTGKTGIMVNDKDFHQAVKPQNQTNSKSEDNTQVTK